MRQRWLDAVSAEVIVLVKAADSTLRSENPSEVFAETFNSDSRDHRPTP
jgi:hypothetical protein